MHHSLSRVPMNVITCGALLCLHVEAISNDKRIVFGACLLLSLLGTFLCNRFISVFRDEAAIKKGSTDIENDVKSGKKLQWCWYYCLKHINTVILRASGGTNCKMVKMHAYSLNLTILTLFWETNNWWWYNKIQKNYLGS